MARVEGPSLRAQELQLVPAQACQTLPQRRSCNNAKETCLRYCCEPPGTPAPPDGPVHYRSLPCCLNCECLLDAVPDKPTASSVSSGLSWVRKRWPPKYSLDIGAFEIHFSRGHRQPIWHRGKQFYWFRSQTQQCARLAEPLSSPPRWRYDWRDLGDQLSLGKLIGVCLRVCKGNVAQPDILIYIYMGQLIYIYIYILIYVSSIIIYLYLSAYLSSIYYLSPSSSSIICHLSIIIYHIYHVSIIYHHHHHYYLSSSSSSIIYLLSIYHLSVNHPSIIYDLSIYYPFTYHLSRRERTEQAEENKTVSLESDPMSSTLFVRGIARTLLSKVAERGNEWMMNSGCLVTKSGVEPCPCFRCPWHSHSKLDVPGTLLGFQVQVQVALTSWPKCYRVGSVPSSTLSLL